MHSLTFVLITSTSMAVCSLRGLRIPWLGRKCGKFMGATPHAGRFRLGFYCRDRNPVWICEGRSILLCKALFFQSVCNFSGNRKIRVLRCSQGTVEEKTNPPGRN